MSETDGILFGQGSEQEADLFDQDSIKEQGLRTRAKVMLGALALSIGVIGGVLFEDEYDVLNSPTGDFLTDIAPQLDALDDKCDTEADQLTDDEFTPIPGTPTKDLINEFERVDEAGQSFYDTVYTQCFNAAVSKVNITAVDGPDVYQPFQLEAVTD